MKTLRQYITPLLLILLAASLVAISLLEPLVQPRSHLLDEASPGIASHLLGSPCQDFDVYDQARRCNEAATRIHLAMLDIHQHNLRDARENTNAALRETLFTPDVPDASLAMTYAVKASHAAAQQDARAAIKVNQQAINLWTHGRGAAYGVLAAVYALRGIAFDLIGNHQAAVDDLRTALALEHAPGRGTPTCMATEIRYARILRHVGATDQAALVEANIKTTNANPRQPQCNGCTMSVESFR
jgi:tetratricopeptide (TPR) repeat protein